MVQYQAKQNITVRGGIINVPHSTTPTHPPRHQPDTPPTKKRTSIRPDHKIPAGDSPTPVKDSPPPQQITPDEPPDEPQTDSPD